MSAHGPISAARHRRPTDPASEAALDISGLDGAFRGLDDGDAEPSPAAARLLLDRIGWRPAGWESPRIQRVREALRLRTEALAPLAEASPIRAAIVSAVDTGAARVALTFAGQASEYIEPLAAMAARSPAVARLVDAVHQRLQGHLEELPATERALFGPGLDLRAWLQSPESRPSADALAQSNISQPLIFTAQVAALLDLGERGLGPSALNPIAAAGHSQGVMAAVFAAEAWGRPGEIQRAADFAGWLFWQGVRMHQCTVPAALPPAATARALADGMRAPTPMAAIAGLTDAELAGAIRDTGITHSLVNGRLRHAVSGEPEALERLRLTLRAGFDARSAARKRGRHGGRLPEPSWEYLPVSGAYHSPSMAPGLTRTLEDLARLGIVVDGADLAFPVLDPSTGAPLPRSGDLVPCLLQLQFLEPVRWTSCVAALPELGVTHVLDLGPGDGVLRLTAAALRGHATAVMTAATEAARTALGGDAPLPQAPPSYATWHPVRSATGRGVETAFTRLTGRSPVLLPGMTPTTVEAPIVAAAANAGYVAELAGGGQVTEAILRARLAELQTTLEPGAGVVLNTLYLDPHLWKLHCGGTEPLVCRLRAEGLPLHGVTISAGLPPVDEAAVLLRRFAASGLWLNAVKPGTSEQIRQALAIADAVPELQLVVQIEGGKAGGHHSFDDLDELLIAHYAAIRARGNVVLAVGGGIGSPERAADLLDGAWALAHGLPRMPVDAVFLGTVTMAALEAATSPAVKAALVAAPGTQRWVLDGDTTGGITSGRSGLDAPIYYLDNAAARVSVLLDAVAGDPAALVARRAELVSALAATAKPYFGDADRMTWLELLERFVTLAAVGRSRAYDDGVWPDASYRRRFGALVRRAEARLAGGTRRVPSVVSEQELHDPRSALARLAERYPALGRTNVGEEDARFFVRTCRSPGKPQNFIAAIDGEIRRAFRSDALWQAHDPAFPASAVLTIPGPEAAAGITNADEPVADILARYEAALLGRLPLAPPRSPSSSSELAAGSGDLAWESVSQLEHALAEGLLGSGPLFEVLRARDAVDPGDRRRWPNPARAALAPAPGRRLRWVRDGQGRLTLLEALDADRSSAHASMTSGVVQVALVSGSVSSPATLDLALEWRPDGALPWLAWHRARYIESQAAFYGQLLFGRPASGVAPFCEATGEVTVTREAIAGFVSATADDSRGLAEQAPLAMVFPLAWEAVFAALAGAKADVLALLHEENALEAGPAWPIVCGDRLRAEARVTRLEATPAGRRIEIRAVLRRGAAVVATVTSRFIVRGEPCGAPRSEWTESRRVPLAGPAERDWLCAQSWFAPSAPVPTGVELELNLRLVTEPGRYAAEGQLLRGSEVIGTLALPLAELAANPVIEVAKMLAVSSPVVPLPARPLGQEEVLAPRDLTAYALASGDRNPIHLDAAIARFAGLPGPIVHGAFTASAALHRAVRLATDGDATRLRSAAVRFLAPVLPGERLEVAVRQVGLLEGGPRLEIDVTTRRAGEAVRVLAGDVSAAPPKTAYACPGQGIQAPGMGMDGYARSRAARAVWDDAERICREQLGFSLLQVVRESPRELVVRGRRLVHPKGVLFLTQFTQVGMAVLAVAQVAELRERGALCPDALFCGHSVGEYAVLGAVAGVVPLEALVKVVYERGLTMDRLVERDAAGASPYAMSVARPNVAGLDEAGLLALVTQVREETGLWLEVVNFNVRGRQYSVTGHVGALDALEAALVLRARGGRVAPLVRVPGVDVPFHSTLLRDGVPPFREALRRVLPEDVAPERLNGRYIPNLVAVPFGVTVEFARHVLAASGSPEVEALLLAWESTPQGARARILLIELLAYQFASPVRWIETQELVFDRTSGVDVFVELGLAASPTVAAMARATLDLDPARVRRPRVLNSEAQFEELFGPLAVAPVQDEISAPRPAQAAAVVAQEPGRLPAGPPAHGPTALQVPPGGPIEDAPVSVEEAVLTIVAQQARLRADQLDLSETLDEVLGGNSARRNQVLADLGAELGAGVIDGAHAMPLRDLAAACRTRAARYAGPGSYLGPALDAALARTLGAARLGRKDLESHLVQAFGLGPGRTASILNRLLLASRVGDSARGGPLSLTAAPASADRSAALAWVSGAVEAYARDAGIALSRPALPGASAAVDSAALDALSARLLGPDGILARTASGLLGELGQPLGGSLVGPELPNVERERLALYDAEHDQDASAYTTLIQPVFDAEKHAPFASSWAWRRRDVLELAWRADATREEAEALASRLDDGARSTAAALATVAEREGRDATLLRILAAPRLTSLPFAGRTAFVTGAGPGSIAAAMVDVLLAGGARVIATTSRYSAERLASWKRRYQEVAAPGAELHVVPMNQGSMRDVDAAVAWAMERWVPDLLIPFAAIPESADLTGLGGRSLASIRVLVLGVERLIARIAEGYRARPGLGRCHVLLPLSPNHGLFGGDGVYGECKAALEVLLPRWKAEQHAWGRFVSLALARIGWVRGTGLMHQNDSLVAELEAQTGLVTWSQPEMAGKLLELCSDSAREQAAAAPLVADLTGGLATIVDLPERFRAVRERLDAEQALVRRRAELDSALARVMSPPATPTLVAPLGTVALPLPEPSDAELVGLPALDHLDARRVVAVIGYGEVGPYGSARTRWAIEKDRQLSLEGVAELAWTTGLVKPAEEGWADAETGLPVDEVDLPERYEARLLAHAGIRIVEPKLQGFDPAAGLSFLDVHLDRDFAFPVPSREAAEALRAGDPDHTEVREQGGELTVVRKAGAVVKVRRAVRIDRTTVGQIPTGWDATRLGIPPELVAQVDRTTLFLLVATAEAFLAAGLEPEELQDFLHPARIGSTQSSGIGGMLKLRRLYQDFLLGAERQNDTLQETLVNVIAGWVVQGYVGSYGPMSAPVAACATAAVSVADAVDKILCGAADVVVAGGVDDYGLEGAVGFQDMGATASTDVMAARGIGPAASSRPNDRRRGGFVESQGAGALLLCRADLAIAQGLPVYGVVVYAGSFADGVHRSVPAPGLGALAAAAERAGGLATAYDACGFEARKAQIAALDAQRPALAAALGEAGAELCLGETRRSLAHDVARHTGASPLRAALGVLGLGPDDVAMISTHGTSTLANDLNEAKLHQWLAEGLGRTPGLPLAVISQKALTGHPKGAAAAWQMNGLLQAMADGAVPGNANLDDPDPALEESRHLAFTDRVLAVERARLKVGLVTSLGFGHASALVALGHPFLFWRLMDAGAREAYRARLAPRVEAGNRRLRGVLSGRTPLVTIRTERAYGEGRREAAMLMNSDARRSLVVGRSEAS